MKTHTFLITSRSMVLRMRNAADKFVKKPKTHFMFKELFSKIVLL